MAKWTVEKFTQELQTHLGDRLVSVILFGSAAGGDHAGTRSDINLLVVTKELGVQELLSLSKATVPWVGQGHSSPLLLTDGHWEDLIDVFPVELQDLQHNHKVLFGKDPLGALRVPKDKLKVELEHELRGKLLRLKSQFVLTEGKTLPVEKLLTDSLSTFLVLFKAALALYDEPLPKNKMEALTALRKHVEFDLAPFKTIYQMKQGTPVPGTDALRVFEAYMKAIETVVEKIA